MYLYIYIYLFLHIIHIVLLIVIIPPHCFGISRYDAYLCNLNDWIRMGQQQTTKSSNESSTKLLLICKIWPRTDLGEGKESMPPGEGFGHFRMKRGILSSWGLLIMERDPLTCLLLNEVSSFLGSFLLPISCCVFRV